MPLALRVARAQRDRIRDLPGGHGHGFRQGRTLRGPCESLVGVQGGLRGMRGRRRSTQDRKMIEGREENDA